MVCPVYFATAVPISQRFSLRGTSCPVGPQPGRKRGNPPRRIVELLRGGNGRLAQNKHMWTFVGDEYRRCPSRGHSDHRRAHARGARQEARGLGSLRVFREHMDASLTRVTRVMNHGRYVEHRCNKLMRCYTTTQSIVIVLNRCVATMDSITHTHTRTRTQYMQRVYYTRTHDVPAPHVEADEAPVRSRRRGRGGYDRLLPLGDGRRMTRSVVISCHITLV